VLAGRKRRSFVSSFRAVAGVRYTIAIIILYVMAATLGGIIYPHLTGLAVEPTWKAAQLWTIKRQLLRSRSSL